MFAVLLVILVLGVAAVCAAPFIVLVAWLIGVAGRYGDRNAQQNR